MKTTSSDWTKHNPYSTLTVDHQVFQNFIHQYLYFNPTGINLVHYSKVTAKDKEKLNKYIDYLSKIPISHYSRDEQLAFWINLYNALTIQVVIKHFPVKSIRDIHLDSFSLMTFFNPGPWNTPLITIEGVPLSLDNIENEVIRSVWKDPRIHYGLNCASLGCPNLQSNVYTGKNINSLLDKAAKEYINNPRGVSINDGKLIASKIYLWYQADFGGSDQSVIKHLKQYAEPLLKNQLNHFSNIYDYEYDWSLNGD